MITIPAWTAPFHGVQHLGKFSTKAHWVTVCDYGTFAELSCWFPGCGFSPIHSTHDNAAQARREGEKYMRGHSLNA